MRASATAPYLPTMPGAELRLTLMRHAKSSWHDDNLPDHDRPLNARGRRDAPRMAARLATLAPPVSHLCCSSAERTRETAALMARCCSPSCTEEFREALYLASDDTLWRVALDALSSSARQSDAEAHVLVLAHYPGIHTLSRRLCAAVPAHFPTAAYCHLAFERSAWMQWVQQDAGNAPPEPEDIGTAMLRDCGFDYPKRLDD